MNEMESALLFSVIDVDILKMAIRFLKWIAVEIGR